MSSYFSAEYAAALDANSVAIRKFLPVQAAYRAGTVDDATYLAARREYDEAMAVFDAARAAADAVVQSACEEEASVFPPREFDRHFKYASTESADRAALRVIGSSERTVYVIADGMEFRLSYAPERGAVGRWNRWGYLALQPIAPLVRID